MAAPPAKMPRVEAQNGKAAAAAENAAGVGRNIHPCLNPELRKLDSDFLYHLGLSTQNDLPAMFGDVRLVCMHGSADRALRFAQRLGTEVFNVPKDDVKPLGKTERCIMCKVGPVISISHGMGMPSMSIFLHEVTKMLCYAGCPMESMEFVRMGTSGGIGVDPGTVVISKEGFDSCLLPGFEHVSLGKKERWPALANAGLVERLAAVAKGQGADSEDLPALVGCTMGADDFYEGQGRLDGALSSWYTAEDKLEFLKKAHSLGVRNIEMECQCFLAFYQRLGVGAAAVVCPTLVNRLNGDQVTSTPEELQAYTDRVQKLMIRYIRQKFPKLCSAGSAAGK
eukprot:TRINITY_DN6213_c0_g1_i1.p1 TRINITY_DN6213_c0_g1~~TRINITY_DN6213_c0_g1_i1.p1  ORF type:complete len:339 (-),score=99.46 TRINITY_DN6213_c0_g1_i1:218-1234(-)